MVVSCMPTWPFVNCYAWTVHGLTIGAPSCPSASPRAKNAKRIEAKQHNTKQAFKSLGIGASTQAMSEGTMGSYQRVPGHVVKAYQDLQKSGLEPMARLQEAVAMFTKENLAWQAAVCHEVLIHPDKRGGTMLNAHDVHQKGH